MSATDTSTPDVMQVCRNGHVITDLLHTYPERGLNHCDRCGAPTLDHCATCGQPLPGAVLVPGLLPVGRLQAPRYCSTCGAAFPWAGQTPSVAPHLPVLEALLRRLPLVVRQLRTRHGNRPAFRVDDVHDLEDLVRSLLPLHFDDVRPEARTPSYAAATRTDFLLDAGAVAVVVKRASPALREPQFAAEWAEDAAYYRKRGRCRTLVGLVLDAECMLPEPERLERAWSSAENEEIEVRCVIAR